MLAGRGRDANLHGPSVHGFENFMYGAPPMAPLLFPNLMVLGIIAVWQLRNHETYARSYPDR